LCQLAYLGALDSPSIRKLLNVSLEYLWAGSFPVPYLPDQQQTRKIQHSPDTDAQINGFYCVLHHTHLLQGRSGMSPLSSEDQASKQALSSKVVAMPRAKQPEEHDPEIERWLLLADLVLGKSPQRKAG
jgi:hypothetical protein